MPLVIVKSPVVAPVNEPVPTTNSSALSSKPIKTLSELPLSPTIPISPDGVPVVPVDNSISLSSMTELVVDSVVVEPFTVKLPVTVKSLPPEIVKSLAMFVRPDTVLEKVTGSENVKALEFEVLIVLPC